MTRIQTAKIVFCIAALIFAAKPFIGFGVTGYLRSSPVKTNILVKIFSKRKIEDVRSSMSDIQKLLSDPSANLFLRFAFLLAILFPLAFKANDEINNRFLTRLQPQQLTLLTGQLLI